jgi:hypothetical protein|tara:strand:- start:234 stop:431 length:198 start_codon:yes stop_codon:yes gene_type:complete
MKNLIADFKRLLEIEKERNEALKDIQGEIGFDISFSDEQIFKNAMDNFKKQLDKQIAEEISSWMK